MARMTKYSVQDLGNDHKVARNFGHKQPIHFLCDYIFNKDEIIFTKENVRFFRINVKKVLYQHFGIKMILYSYNKSTSKKDLILEASGDSESLLKFKTDLNQRNIKKSRDFPLSLKFESKVGDSPFSDKSKILNLRGFLNLFILYSLLNYSRLIIEHTLNYKQIFWDNWKILFPDWPLHHILLLMFTYAVVLVLAYFLQYYSFKGKLSPLHTDIIAFTLLSVYFLFASWLIYIFNFSVFVNMFLNGCTISILFKAISFSHVCHSVRIILASFKNKSIDADNYEEYFQENELSKENFDIIFGAKDDPVNLIPIEHCMFYFFIPTFDFKLSYKKKEKINKIFLIKRMTETVILWGLFFFMIAHFVVPIIQKSDDVFIKETHILEKLTYFVKLALACTASWIVMFIAVFHGYCQSVSEILRYSDRAFYLDWWNSRNLSQYWRTWNLPIHSFFLRHVSNPLTSMGLNRHAINTIVFIISAIFHEYIISLSLKKFCTWTLVSFSMQYFYILFEQVYMKYFKLEKSNYGNYMFWGMFCVYGQPTLVLQYYFYIKYGQNFSLWPF
jgi:hypothetical protein